MSTVFVILFLLTLVLLIVSMVKPGLGKGGVRPKRKDLALGFGFFAVLFLILIGVTAPKQKPALQVSNAAKHSQSNTQAASDQSQPATTQTDTQPSTTTSPPVAPSPSPTPAPPSIDTSSAAYKLAQYDLGSSPSASDVATYQTALDGLLPYCTEKDEMKLAGQIWASWQDLKKNGINDETNLTLISHIETSIPDSIKPTDCQGIMAAYLVLRETPSN
jgi:hypothetical protein